MEQFKQWWQSITQREQQLTILSAVMLVIAAIYWGVWAPQYEQLAENKKQLDPLFFLGIKDECSTNLKID